MHYYIPISHIITPPLPADASSIHEMMKASWYATYIDQSIGITTADIDAIYTPETEANQIRALRSRAEHPRENDVSLVAKEGDNVVGFIRLKIHPDFVEWLSLYVHPDHTGKGIGTKLWEAARTRLPQDLPISVEVATYTKAVAFYKKLGFVDTGERSAENIMPVSKTRMPLMKLILNR